MPTYDTAPSYFEVSWFEFIKNHLHNDFFRSGLNLAVKHKEMGMLTVCMMSLNSNANEIKLALDFRYPINITKEDILEQLDKYSFTYGFKINIIKNMTPLFVDSQDDLIQKLLDSYELVMGERPAPITKGGASYARTLKKGVSFGATFEGEQPNPHLSNETMKISSIKKVIAIYANAIINLTK